MHVGDTIFIFCLALIIFGPKKLPEIGRQIGKLMVEFRRASNEFKMQIEEELRASEEAERQKEITAATTMLPSAAAPALSGSTAETPPATSTSAPVIAPPSTGLPVNHTFAAEQPEASTEEPMMTPDDGAYPEMADEYNSSLNTASNGAIDDLPVAALNAETAERAAIDQSEAEKAPTPIHHG